MEALYGALRHSLRAPPHRSVPPLNLHRARVRRNRGRLPSSRCIESAQTHRARACALPARASDTTLGLLARNNSDGKDGSSASLASASVTLPIRGVAGSANSRVPWPSFRVPLSRLPVFRSASGEAPSPPVRG